jgi:hypothetical protein
MTGRRNEFVALSPLAFSKRRYRSLWIASAFRGRIGSAFHGLWFGLSRTISRLFGDRLADETRMGSVLQRRRPTANWVTRIHNRFFLTTGPVDKGPSQISEEMAFMDRSSNSKLASGTIYIQTSRSLLGRLLRDRPAAIHNLDDRGCKVFKIGKSMDKDARSAQLCGTSYGGASDWVACCRFGGQIV